MNTRSNFLLFNCSSDLAGSFTSMPCAFTLRRFSAASTALPLFSDTSRSADVPPINTATLPNRAAGPGTRFATRRFFTGTAFFVLRTAPGVWTDCRVT